MKNIYQIQKLVKRISRRSRGALHALTKEKSKNPPAKPWKGLTGANVVLMRHRLFVAAQADAAVKRELEARRIGKPGLRDARPLKVQRKLGLIPAVA